MNKHTAGKIISSASWALENIGIFSKLPKADRQETERFMAYVQKMERSHADLLKALQGFLDMYVPMINSGDCGNWNPEKEPQVIAARAAIAKATS